MAKNIPEQVKSLILPFAEKLSLELWDIEYKKEGPSYFLRIFIDSDKGITIDDCEKLSRAIDKPLDEADIIPDSYCLEVSSAGLDRVLKTKRHFEKYIGHDIEVKLYRGVLNLKKFEGKLLSYNDGAVTILYNNEELCFEAENVAKVNLAVRF